MPQDPSTMYRWRQMTAQQRAEVLTDRIQYGRPPHSVRHFQSDTTTYYMVTAACFELLWLRQEVEFVVSCRAAGDDETATVKGAARK